MPGTSTHIADRVARSGFAGRSPATAVPPVVVGPGPPGRGRDGAPAPPPAPPRPVSVAGQERRPPLSGPSARLERLSYGANAATVPPKLATSTWPFATVAEA